MKKFIKGFIKGFIFLFCLETLIYSQEISKKEGMKIIKQIRREIEIEKKAKEKIVKDEEKAKVVAKKEEEKKGKKILKNIRRDINESLEEKVFRSENTPEARINAIGAAFKIGKDRMTFLNIEEEEIMKFEANLGVERNNKNVLLGQKFDKVHDKFKTNKNDIEILLVENEKLREYLSRLYNMEQKVKTGK